MSEDSDKGQGERDAHWATSADAKPTYQAPVVMPLGELTRGLGQCAYGSYVTVECKPGTNPTDKCAKGTIPYAV